eukprot:SAG11_NODE_2196_length_3699_cov_2.962222_1_plen_33_part_10
MMVSLTNTDGRARARWARRQVAAADVRPAAEPQ